MSCAEIIGIQAGIGITNGLYRYAVQVAEAVERFACGDGMEGFLRLAFFLAGDAQGASYVYLFVTTRIQSDNVGLADAIHAGDGVKTLTFFDGMQKVCLVFLCTDAEAAGCSQQQGAKGAFGCFHSNHSFGFNKNNTQSCRKVNKSVAFQPKD